MIKIGASTLILWAAGICGAQTPIPAPQTAGTPPKYFRLIFVLTYPPNQQPAQSFQLDVPVDRDRTGMASISQDSGLTGQADAGVQQTLQCTDVHQSSIGLAANVVFTMDRVDSEPVPGSDEHLHHKFSFDRKVDVAFARSTRITEEVERVPLKKGDEALSNSLPAAPQITLTAIPM